jgi:hypothetical protein
MHNYCLASVGFYSWEEGQVQGELGTMALACNPSYSGDKGQEDHHSKPARANSSRDPILKILNTKKGLLECLKW